MIIIMNNYEVNFFLHQRQGDELTLLEGEERN
jgi:hypothetical protein